MRWIEEAVQKGRNQTMSSSSSLLSVKMFRDAVKASGGIRGSESCDCHVTTYS